MFDFKAVFTRRCVYGAFSDLTGVLQFLFDFICVTLAIFISCD